MIPTLRASAVLDRIAAMRGDAQLLASLAADPRARFLVLSASRPVITGNAAHTEAAIRWLDAGAVLEHGLDPASALFLGVDPDSGAGCFAIHVLGADVERLEGSLKPAVDLRSLATQGVMVPEEISLLGLAKSLSDWHAKHGFCASCGVSTQSQDGGWRRVCPDCGHQAFPRVDPVVIMAITGGERLVLARQSRFPEHMYSLPAGFVEPGEDIEHAVRRETKEETGIGVGRVHYMLSQPWPFPHSLMIGCMAEALTGDITRDEGELEDARWFSREEVSAMLEGTHPDGLWVPGEHAIAHVLIRRWLDGSTG